MEVIMDDRWLAGLLEGEGCFTVDKNNRVAIHLTMTDEDVILSACRIAGVGNVRGPYKWGDSRQQVWRWTVGNYEDVEVLLNRILPFMHYRRKEKIKELLSAIYERKNKRELPTGVYKSNSRFKAILNGTHLGTYSTPDDAKNAYNNARREQRNEFGI
jgi:hypothetical protein